MGNIYRKVVVAIGRKVYILVNGKIKYGNDLENGSP